MSDKTDKLAQLYDNYNQLNAAKDNILEYEACYLSILSSVKGGQQEKQLASQFIAKFFVHFPKYYDIAIDSLLDLCEDDDINIRRHAIKELPTICRERKEYVPKMADVLAQLLQTEDTIELNIVNNSLSTLAKYDVNGFLGGMFSQIMSGEDVVRERAIKFLKERLKMIATGNEHIFTKEVEEYFVAESRKVMQDVNKDEFVAFMSMLSGLKLAKSISGQQTLLSIILEQAELSAPFDTADFDFIDKLMMCIRHAIPLFSKFIASTELVKYICVQVLPQLTQLEASNAGIELDVLQMLAEMSAFASFTNDAMLLEKCESRVLSKLLQYMPCPPTQVADSETDDEPSLQFSHIECLLFTFHQFCKQNASFFADSNSDKVKDFKLRLQYVARGVQSYITKLRKHLSTVKGESLKTDENKLKVMALKTTSNINTLIRDLFKVPPNFKSNILLSWKPVSAKSSNALSAQSADVSAEEREPIIQSAQPLTNIKRQIITAPENSDAKRERKLYAPPGGKFSTSVKRFSSPTLGPFRGRRGSTRGRAFNRQRKFFSYRWNNQPYN